jgi:hypothetical protein
MIKNMKRMNEGSTTHMSIMTMGWDMIMISAYNIPFGTANEHNEVKNASLLLRATPNTAMMNQTKTKNRKRISIP